LDTPSYTDEMSVVIWPNNWPIIHSPVQNHCACPQACVFHVLRKKICYVH